ncbi:hypothetical protein NQ317_005783 [Molorchus minor]|uniref:Uncharacterized protein n=1 Tax=Molorchus minor TaxID=1323400 RepID=A0ABQ9JA74_9CUCU|nr:hypothetical protein NQ317_005783 [Molorchus minor]
MICNQKYGKVLKFGNYGNFYRKYNEPHRCYVMTIGNIGIGLLLLIIIWIAALIVFVVGVKLQSNISWIALGSATAITVLLLIIPADRKNRPVNEPEINVV